MTDDLDDLRAALRAAPAFDDAAKADALRLAMENFDRLQGSGEDRRLMEDRPKGAGFLNGVRAMLTSLTRKPVLAASTSAAALALGMVLVLPNIDRAVLTGTVEVAPGTLATDESRTLVPAEPAPADSLADATATKGEARMAVDQASDVAVAATEQSSDAPVGLAEEESGVAAAPMASQAVADAGFADFAAPQPENTEAFASAPANPVRVTAEEPVSTFSIDVDTASYAVVRSSLNAGVLPDPASVRVEEMVNYFPYAYPAPDEGAAFRSTVTVMPTPWNAETRLVHIGIQGTLPEVGARPPLNLVFLIDTSGSMDDPGKLPLLRQSLALMLPELRAEDQVAIVAYAGSAGLVLPPTASGNRADILAALDRLAAGGGTAGAEGIALAYQVARGMAAEGEVSRVLLATDGDFNLGMDDPEALKGYIAEQRESGVYLSVLGFGRGNLDDATMQALAQNGNGSAAYIDTLAEARKVLVDQVAGALFPIADNVKIQIEWNPAEVAEYRLIGYETRALRREDFNNDNVDAGDIGAGTQVTAIYEITAPGSPALLNDPLHYGSAAAGQGGELGFLRLRHVAPGQTESALQETPILSDLSASNDEARFAAAIAGFGQLLTGSVYLGEWGWDEVIALAQSARGEDAFGYRAEAVTLMRLAEALSR